MAVIEAPPRTQEQRREALTQANVIRRERSELKEALKTGARTLSEILADPPDCVLHALVGEVLLARRPRSPENVHRLLVRARLTGYREVIDLDAQQWRALRFVVQAEEDRRR